MAGKISEGKVLEGVDAAGAITIGVDVHNDESPAHVLVWSGSDFAEDAAAFNSEGDGAAPGQGSATFWGLKLAKANVTAATIGDAKFSEE